MPGIKKLDQDGVPLTTLHQTLPHFEQRLEVLLDHCDHAQRSMGLGIQSEYKRWDYGDSALLPLIDDVAEFVEEALLMLPQGTPA